jgi:hypothetical protein
MVDDGLEKYVDRCTIFTPIVRKKKHEICQEYDGRR